MAPDSACAATDESETSQTTALGRAATPIAATLKPAKSRIHRTDPTTTSVALRLALGACFALSRFFLAKMEGLGSTSVPKPAARPPAVAVASPTVEATGGRAPEDIETALLPPGAASSSSDHPRGTGPRPSRESPDGRPFVQKTLSKLTKVPASIVEKAAPWVGAAATTLHRAVLETATPEGAQRLAASTYERIKSDVMVSCHASHDMLVLWMYPTPFKVLEIDEQYRHWSVRWNPFYWAMFLPLIPCILTGKWLHATWGQGDMMRPDETVEESRVRLHWIYCLDGPIAVAVLLDLVDVLLDVPFYTQRKFTNQLLSWVMTLTVTSAYVLANSYFLDVMRRRSLVGVRLVIVYQTVFAVGLLNMLVAGAVHNKTTARHGEYIFETWLQVQSAAPPLRRPSTTFRGLPRPSVTFHDLPWPSMAFRATLGRGSRYPRPRGDCTRTCLPPRPPAERGVCHLPSLAVRLVVSTPDDDALYAGGCIRVQPLMECLPRREGAGARAGHPPRPHRRRCACHHRCCKRPPACSPSVCAPCLRPRSAILRSRPPPPLTPSASAHALRRRCPSTSMARTSKRSASST